jgi:sodium transport system permease protein
MNWANVKLILGREVRDQLRDRRTLFMIAVLPILLYPLLGMSFFQIAQFMREQPTSVLVVGARDFGDLPPLLTDGQFVERLFERPGQSRLLELTHADGPASGSTPLPEDREHLRGLIQKGEYDAALYFPPDFVERLQAYREEMRQYGQRASAGPSGGVAPPQVPNPEIIYTTAIEKSQLAFARLNAALRAWTEEIGRSNLAASGVPADAARPFDVHAADVAAKGRRGAAFWSKILPVLLLLWAMTGAFYPAVDLCAGEKERGTLETLLSSPAERTEIVLGKLITIMLFSMVTSVLNLISMGITGLLLLSRMPQMGGPPPATAALWLAIALVPVSALFSALCLALAAFARSTKEGQYYLMPLLLITMPLVILPMAPTVELNLGNSLIPVTGVVLVLRALLEGHYLVAVQYLPPVVAVTLTCCLLAIRWAADQFNSESVLFRESERLDVGLWMRHLLQARQPTPTVAGAVFCGVMILVVRFFLSLTVAPPVNFHGTVNLVLVTQLVVVLTPTLLMTVMLTSSPRQTLLLCRPPWSSVLVAGVLAVVLFPLVALFSAGVRYLYPVSAEVVEVNAALLRGAPGFWQTVLLLAAIPAICEELAFRGFILSGFRHLGHKWRAIFYSALFFGLSHALLQQSITAWVLGLVIAFLAVQTGSIVPGVVFHVIHNTLGLAIGEYGPRLIDRYPTLSLFINPDDPAGILFRWPAIVLAVASSMLLLIWFRRLPYPRSPEERQQDALTSPVTT